MDSNANWGRQNIVETQYMFWTRCVNCGHGHKYSRECMNRVMRCSVCQKSYVACNIGDETSSSTKKRGRSVEEFKNVVSEVDGFDAAGTKRDKRPVKHKAEDHYTQLHKRMDELEKERIDVYTLKQHEGCIMHDIKKEMENPTHVVKPESSDIMKVQELAVVWIEKIRSTSLMTISSEVMDFLHFIGAYRLQISSSIISQEETARLASYIAHFKHAPTIIQSLGLNHFVPEYVEKLISIRIYIAAVRLICFFKLKGFSPLHLLGKEITNLRSQSKAEVKDGWRLRQTLELMAEYKLEVDIPGDLLVKFMGL
ncbi:hypothetical protein CARUB_v10014228mg [Capsella rubella]|uniref:FRIGIDA-like protein n=1 Tax=Capsella rubella TaxID=81985 RepID=R0G678_9BRAS|nr:uncharacterized protein LOC17893573 [Capsella rubella]EOA31077.1 hypothetical protein CARUB_v10014228mg [Capsella rubella]